MSLRRVLLFALLGLIAMTAHATGPGATHWTTPAEAAHFRTTPGYADTLAYLQRLQQAAPGVIRLETFGTTPAGRPMTVVIASGDGSFDPAAARAAHKPVVLVQAGIHPGEIEAKEYAEPRVLEKLAREMLAKDPVLNAAFEQKLHDDPAFAADSDARLGFFFERSPWYTAQQVGAYPVLRLDSAQLHGLPVPVAAR